MLSKKSPHERFNEGEEFVGKINGELREEHTLGGLLNSRELQFGV